MTTRPAAAPAWLLALCAALALALGALWLAPGAPAAWRTWQAPAPQAPSLADADAALLTANPAATAGYPAILQRPVMDPARRPQTASPAAAAAAAAAPPPAAIEQATLLGIVAGPALNGVLLDYEGQPRFVRRGERVGDWTLDSLRERTATFVRDGERRHIDLPFVRGGGAAPSAGRPSSPARPAPAPSPAGKAAPAAPAPARKAAPSAPAAAFGGSAPVQPASAPR